MTGTLRPASPSAFGDLLRGWRQRRRLSQLDLAGDADISARHLSFVETGRSTPSRDMVLRLAEQLDVPLRERNALLLAAGYAPMFAERPLHNPALCAAREAVQAVLTGHEPYPALAIDRHWTLVAANQAVGPLLVGVAPELLAPPVNVLRLSLHPGGLAPRIVNLGEWRLHLLTRLDGQIGRSGDPELEALRRELAAYPFAEHLQEAAPIPAHASVFVPLRLEVPQGSLTLLSTTTVFGTPLDVTLSELAIEAFFPADAATGERLRGLMGVPTGDGQT
ncbi:helix-turn-helix domain-containing protein [Deinococcus apachensis]|uniref:helix-turn-helix domain-containing protein n=1 Tax=Deinococcus apachensis TaxID=309886 RepID=UPI000372F7DB|nr:helix-turn-helix transcriptional regulator [Deinococcus apachensis]